MDHHYYTTLSQHGEYFYDWQRQLINMACNSDEIHFSGQKPTDQERKIHSVFVHEYIHYLQNLAMAWGVPLFTDSSLGVIKIGASSVLWSGRIDLPIDVASLPNKLFSDGIDLVSTVIDRLKRNSTVTPNLHAVRIPTTLRRLGMPCMRLTNGIITADVGVKVIREHMAHLGAELFLNRSDAEIHQNFENAQEFSDQGVVLSAKSEYWILFEYLYHLHSFTELARGLFHLTQHCLLTAFPELTLMRFMEWLNGIIRTKSQPANFLTLFETWSSSKSEVFQVSVDIDNAIRHCKKTLDLTAKHLNDHDIFRFTHTITEYALNNLASTKGGLNLFELTDKFDDFQYWKRKLNAYGSGIIRYTDKVTIVGNTQHISKMEECFKYLLSSSIVVRMVLDNQLAICPFLDDIPICGAKFRASKNCSINPFLVVETDAYGGSCLFRNGILMLGLQDRVHKS